MTGRSDITPWLQEAVSLHQAGRLDEAERLYDKVLTADRRNPDALNLKGLIASHRGRGAEALALFERSIAALATFPDAHFNKAMALAGLGRLDDALRSYAEVVRLNPSHADARLNIGTLLHNLGRESEAISAFRTMTEACPHDARGFYNLGHCLAQSAPRAAESARGAIAGEAAAAFTRALSLQPANIDARIALADAQALLGDFAQAAEHLRIALQSAAPWPAARRAEMLSTLGEHLRKLQRHEEAVATHRQAVALRPDHHLIRFNLAAALHDAGHLDDAEALYKELIAAQPDFVKALVNLGNVYRDKNRNEDAISFFEKALAIEPAYQAYANVAATMTDMGWLTTGLMIHNQALSLGSMDAAARYNRALTLLSIGRFQQGWAEHETRFDVAHVGTVRRPPPEWRGEDLAGKRILVWTEQGAGDQILHGSMIPDVMARGGQVLIECVARMAPVFARSFPGTIVIGRHHPSTPAAEAGSFDVQIAAGSLGQYLRRDFASFPRHAGYLKADPDKIARFRRSYEVMAAGRRIVGIAWRSLNPRLGANKTAEISNFGPVLQVPGILFVNLQYGDCAGDLADARARFGAEIFHDSSVDSLADLDTFFAQVAAMDAVVTTSNTAVHVAGSLNVPTWLLLPHGKGTMWYWFQHRTDSPWYPAVKIARAHDIDPDRPWEREPLGRVAAELALWAGGAGQRRS